jgi:hypothetical protein
MIFRAESLADNVSLPVSPIDVARSAARFDQMPGLAEG